MASMDMHLSLNQKLIMTPQMEQSLNILQMGLAEIDALAEELTLTNPTIEYGDNKWFGGDKEAYINAIPDASSVGVDLWQDLHNQLHNLAVMDDASDWALMTKLIDLIDERGYLCYEDDELADFLDVSVKRIREARAMFRAFIPLGLGARDLEDCLIMQTEDPMVQELIRYHLRDLAEGKIRKIERAMGRSKKEVQGAIACIKSMEPHPGNYFDSGAPAHFIYPDILINHEEDGYKVTFTKSKSTFLKLSNPELLYKDPAAKKYYSPFYNEGKAILKALQQREETVKAIVLYILETQRDFFDQGKLYLTGMTMADVAAALEIHESTVSRACKDKRLQCRWGVFELKYFFSNKTSKTAVGVTGQSLNPKQKIAQIIEGEAKGSPLSDAAIVKELKGSGIEISRRTVAKYRDQLGIPSAMVRRSW